MDERVGAQQAIRRHVWAGFFDAEEIILIVSEEMREPDMDRLRTEVNEEMARKRAEETTWPATTDCDRLDGVFEALEAGGLIVEQDAGLTKSDGLEIVSEAYEDAEAEGEGATIVGYCFYHGQDLERVRESGALYLAFGAFDGDEAQGAQIGARIKHALQAAGFAVEWSGSVWERILVRGVCWQRRSP